MSRFFIDRPVFAWVIAIGLMLVGALAIVSLPINQFPDVAPPAISIQVVYPGATAQTVRDTAVQVIEQQLNGLDGLRYISSDSNADGTATIIATFEQGTNPDIAQVQVQNKLQVATPMLPQEVQRQGLRVVKYKQNFMLVLALVSEDGRMSSGDLGDLVASRLQDPIARTPGVGDFQLLGSQYAMRIWLDPERLNGFQLTPQDVIGAIQAENVQVASGQVGGLPARRRRSAIRKRHRQGANEDRRGVRADSAQGQRRRFAGSPTRRRDDHARQRKLRNFDEVQPRPTVGRHGTAARDGREPARVHGRRAAHDCRDRAELAARREGGLPLRHVARRLGVDRSGIAHARRGDGARLPRHVPVLAELARHVDTDTGRARRVARDVRGAIRVRFHDQRHDDVCNGARDRFARRRRDHRRRERGTHHGRGRAVTERSDAQVDGSALRRARRRCARAVGRFPADELLRRIYGRHLPPVRDHDHLRDGVLGARRRDLHARALRDSAQAARVRRTARKEGSQALLRLVQPHVRPRRGRLPARRQARAAAARPLHGGLPCDRRGCRRVVQRAAERVPAQ